MVRCSRGVAGKWLERMPKATTMTQWESPSWATSTVRCLNPSLLLFFYVSPPLFHPCLWFQMTLRAPRPCRPSSCCCSWGSLGASWPHSLHWWDTGTWARQSVQETTSTPSYQSWSPSENRSKTGFGRAGWVKRWQVEVWPSFIGSNLLWFYAAAIWESLY